MSKYSIKNNGTINSVGDNNTINNNIYNQKIINEFDKVLFSLDKKTLKVIDEDIIKLKRDLGSNDMNSAILIIKKIGPWISDVAKNVGANLISEMIM